MKDDYLRRRFRNPALAAKIMAHYKRLPMLNMLTRQPFLCWIVATVFERCYRYQGYGTQPPRLTPFYVNILLVQTNRRLQFYYDVSENNLVMSIMFYNFCNRTTDFCVVLFSPFNHDVVANGMQLKFGSYR